MSSTAVGLKKPHQQQERALLQVMQREIERLEEERVHLKTENRKLAVQLGHKAARLGLDADDLRAVQEYRDALRERRRNLSLTPKGTLRIRAPALSVYRLQEKSRLFTKGLN